MTHEEFKKIKTGDKIYVPFIESVGEISTGTHYIGSDSFERFTLRQLTVKDAVVHDYDPDKNQIGWRQGLVVQFVNFDIDSLTEKEKDNYYLTYREYFPVFCKAWDDVKQYKGYFEIPYNKQLTDDGFSINYSLEAISLLSKTKKEARKIVNRLNRRNLTRVDNIIKFYKEKVRPEVKRFIKESKI